MKILYTTHQFLPEHAAGTEILTYSTAKEAARRGHEVRVLTGYPRKSSVEASRMFDRYEYDGIPVDRFSHYKTASMRSENPMEAEYNNLFLADFFRRCVEEYRPDLVHFYHLQRLSAAAIDVCGEMGIPTLLTATDFWLVCPTNQLLLPDLSLCPGPHTSMTNCVRHLATVSQGRTVGLALKWVPDRLLAVLIRAIQRGVVRHRNRYIPLVRALAARPAYMKTRMNRTRVVLVATRFMGELLSRYGLETKRIRHVPFGIDSTRITRMSPKGSEKHLRIGFIGTLYQHKGAHVLIQAVRLLPATLPLKVSIYGDLDEFPDYAETLRALAENDGRISFCGTFPPAEIEKILYEMDVLVVPSLWHENSPLILSLAQAAKVPVVATDSPGISEIITNGDNGLLFEKGDVKGLAAIVSKLCHERATVRLLSDRARAPKSIAAYVDELEGIYDEVLRDRSAA